MTSACSFGARCLISSMTLAAVMGPQYCVESRNDKFLLVFLNRPHLCTPLFSARFNAINAPGRPSSRIKIVIAVQTTVLRGTVGTSGGAASTSSVDLPQCGQSMLVPMASAGNSRCPPHDWHGPFKNLVRFIFWHRNCNNYET